MDDTAPWQHTLCRPAVRRNMHRDMPARPLSPSTGCKRFNIDGNQEFFRFRLSSAFLFPRTCHHHHVSEGVAATATSERCHPTPTFQTLRTWTSMVMCTCSPGRENSYAEDHTRISTSAPLEQGNTVLRRAISVTADGMQLSPWAEGLPVGACVSIRSQISLFPFRQLQSEARELQGTIAEKGNSWMSALSCALRRAWAVFDTEGDLMLQSLITL